jgi:phosphoglycolate phosphatase-like HAD superfamily hydrolase
MKLILFDIDGTIIRSHSAGRVALAKALEDVYGRRVPIDSYRMSGKTDLRIITDLLTAVGLNQAEIDNGLDAAFEQMVRRANEVYPGKGIAPCAGIESLLRSLRSRKDVLLGLLTGNAKGTAPLKLIAAGIDPSQFRVGAFGSDAIERNDLPGLAMKRAIQLTGHEFAGANTVVIGDTPADILCARASKAKAIAVATGWHAADTLEKYSPDYLFENLVDTETVMSILLGED